MVMIKKALDTEEKLKILSQDSRYDLACSCATAKDEHRRRSGDHKWIYPVVLPQGGYTHLFKTLLSNDCVNNCKYCPLRIKNDLRRCTLTPEETAGIFFDYLKASRVSGIFLSSGVVRTADETMARINAAARIIRRSFRGYMHLKVIPGASDAAIRETVSLASAVSVNIEMPQADDFRKVCSSKDFKADILRPMELISSLTSLGSRYGRVKSTTQFVVGASSETDREIIFSSWDLYRRLGLDRVYFSSYQRGAGERDLPGENSRLSNSEMLMREHRLYQVDWMLRKYGFTPNEIALDGSGALPLEKDPKEAWAGRHPEFFPLDVNKSGKFELLRVPGLGPLTVERVLSLRRAGKIIKSIDDLGRQGKRLMKARAYLSFPSRG